MTTTLPESPRAIGLPHDAYRPGQLDTINTLLAVDEQARLANETKFTFVQGPTGYGKSTLTAALATQRPVTMMVTHNALSRQIARDYGFDHLEGGENYACELPEKVGKWKAYGWGKPTYADCHLSEPGSCPAASKCGYLIAKAKAKASKKLSITYAMGSLAPFIRNRAGILVMDEVHSSPSTLLDFSEFSCNLGRAKHYGLPAFPYSSGLDYGERGEGGVMEGLAPDYVMAWLEESASVVGAWMERQHADDTRLMSQAKRFLETLKRLTMYVPHGQWFLRSGRRAIREYDEGGVSYSPGIFLKALDARSVAPRLWQNKSSVLLMSATVGKTPAPLAHELGIDAYTFIDHEHPVPARFRPVFDIGFHDRMTSKNLNDRPTLYYQQALSIRNWLNDLDPAWRGIILTTSYDKIKRLHEYLGRWFPDRLYIPADSRGKVANRISGFLTDPRPGLIAIDTLAGWGAGLDLRGDLARFVVVAGVQYSNWTDAYDRSRLGRPGGRTWDRYEAHNGTMQAGGRPCRGEIDPRTGEFMENYVALADGSALTQEARSFYADFWLQAMQKWR